MSIILKKISNLNINEKLMMGNKINIVIGYDQRILADGLTAIITAEKKMEIIHSVKNGDSLFDIVEREKPNLILFEFDRWMNYYIHYVKKFSESFPWLRILILSEFISHRIAKQIIPYIHGYLLRTCSSEKVILAISQINDSGKYLCPEAIDEFVGIRKKVAETELTLREKDVLSKWLTSENTRDIGLSMHISESTVRTHLKNIKQKLGKINKTQLMIFACRSNLIDIEMKPLCPNCRFYCEHL